VKSGVSRLNDDFYFVRLSKKTFAPMVAAHLQANWFASLAVRAYSIDTPTFTIIQMQLQGILVG